MLKYIKFFLLAPSFWILCSCNTTKSKPLIINFSTDSTKITVKNIDESALFQLKSNLYTDSSYQELVAVLQTPTDDDSTSMEIEWPGKLSLNENELVFTPVLPFIKGKTYVVETILNTQFASGEDIIKDKVGNQIRPHHQILKR